MTVELFVFDARPEVVAAVAGGDPGRRADAVVVDWERSGKAERQRRALDLLGTDTQVGPSRPVDLAPIVGAARVPVICRIDVWGRHGPDDLERAARSGVAEVILPMVRECREVEQAIELAAGRVGVGVMIETPEACTVADRLASLPISRAYLGLMDLAIERRTPDIFTALHDGTLEGVAAACASVPFGFAGLTLPGLGDPVPTVELAAEMVRVGSAFTFLRRSFLRDAHGDLAAGLGSVREMVDQLERASRVGV